MKLFNKAYNPNTWKKEELKWLTTRREEEAQMLMFKWGIDSVDTTEVNIARGIIEGTSSLSDFTPTDKKAIIPVLNKLIESQETDDEDRNLLLKSSTFTKDISDTALQKISDMNTVKFQLDTIEENLAGQDVWPIAWRIASLNPYDTDAQVALAQLAGLTPKVARGIFWEVGVLTDTDIKNYQRALPNMQSTEEKNALVVDFMRDLLAEWYKNALLTQAKGKRNMAQFISDYDEIIEMQNSKTSFIEDTEVWGISMMTQPQILDLESLVKQYQSWYMNTINELSPVFDF